MLMLIITTMQRSCQPDIGKKKEQKQILEPTWKFLSHHFSPICILFGLKKMDYQEEPTLTTVNKHVKQIVSITEQLDKVWYYRI